MPSEPVTTPVETANSYATLAEANTYLDDSVRAGSWEFLDDDSKARALLTATRMLDRRDWDGEKTDSDQTLAFPRTGLEDYVDTQFPGPIIEACIELAYELTQDSGVETTSRGKNTKRLKAGEAEIEYFRPGGVRGLGSDTRFPEIVEEIIKPLLGGGSAAGEVWGNDGSSSFSDGAGYDRTEGWS
jgi:hypothetical protein